MKPINQKQSTTGKFYSSIKDVDMAILRYFNDFLNIYVEQNGESKRVIALYENPERFFSSQQTEYRDEDRKIQYPLIVVGLSQGPTRRGFRQNRDEEVALISGDRGKQVFDRLGVNYTKSPEQVVFVKMPQYYDMTYSVKARANFKNHINKITETILFSDNKFWENESGLKFFVRVEDTSVELKSGEDDERLFESNFSIVVRAYLLPEIIENESNKRVQLEKVHVKMSHEVVLNEKEMRELLKTRGF